MCCLQSVRREPFRAGSLGTEGAYWSLIKRTVEKEEHLTFYLPAASWPREAPGWRRWACCPGCPHTCLGLCNWPKAKCFPPGVGVIRNDRGLPALWQVYFHQWCGKQSCSPPPAGHVCHKTLTELEKWWFSAWRFPQIWERAKGAIGPRIRASLHRFQHNFIWGRKSF